MGGARRQRDGDVWPRINAHAHVCKNENLKLNKQDLMMMMGGGGSTQASSRFVKPRTRGHRVSM